MTLVYLTQAICNAAVPRERRYDLRDSLVRGLFMRVEVSGRKTWYLCYRTPSPERRLRNKKIASALYTQLAVARRMAREYLARLYLERIDPAEVSLPAERKAVSLRALIDMYEPWVCSHQKSGSVTIRALRLFDKFMDMPACALDRDTVERWRSENAGRLKRATINRRVAALQALFAWGAKEGIPGVSAFRLPKLAQTDSKVVTRFLSDDERARLMAELAAREGRSGPDYLMPAVVLSLNTGIRKGTLLGLRWEDVDFASRTLRLRAEIMKSGRDAVMPLNGAALSALSAWREKGGGRGGFVFPMDDGSRRRDTAHAFKRVLDKAGIKNFTWHCLRHDFASQLAMKGVPMHIIQKLMCHGSMAMTQRYAHLSPNSLEEAVRRIAP